VRTEASSGGLSVSQSARAQKWLDQLVQVATGIKPWKGGRSSSFVDFPVGATGFFQQPVWLQASTHFPLIRGVTHAQQLGGACGHFMTQVADGGHFDRVYSKNDTGADTRGFCHGQSKDGC